MTDRQRRILANDEVGTNMKTNPGMVVLIVAAAMGGAPAQAASGNQDPFEMFVGLGGTHDDNLFDLDSGGDLGLAEPFAAVDDEYGFIEAGFNSEGLAALPLSLEGRIYRQAYSDSDFLDHTGGRFDARLDWDSPSDFGGDIGYRYDRRLQDFLNQLVPRRNVIDEHRVDGGIERNFGLRSRLRLSGGVRELTFSDSELLDKKRWDASVHYEYALSRASRIGLMGSFENSDFDDLDERDYSGWFVGPTLTWQASDAFRLNSNLGWSDRSLDDPRDDQEDFDGVTGAVSVVWRPGDFSLNARVFRDVSSLGGETVTYVDRYGASLRPAWRFATRWTLRLNLSYENRDFEPVLGSLIRREDDYYVGGANLEWQANRRLEFTLGYEYENRTSNEDVREFSSNALSLKVRMTL